MHECLQLFGNCTPGHRAGPQSAATEFRGAAKSRTRPGHRAGPQSPATEFRGAAKTRTRGGQEAGPQSSGARPRQGQDPDTEPGHRAQPTEFRGAASECGQLYFSKIEPQQ